MKRKSFLLVAGEASGDLLGAELLPSIRKLLTGLEAVPSPDPQPLRTSLTPRFFGAGGPRMAAAGVDLAFDLTAHSVTGLSDVLRRLLTFRRLFVELLQLAREREPDAIVCIDFSGFNRRFAHAVKRYVRTRRDWFHDWDPKIIQYVSPQVWASREGRARQMAKDYDLVLSIIPFEKDWYAAHAAGLNVQFVGHPVLDRYRNELGSRDTEEAATPTAPNSVDSPLALLLPGSRPGELERHLPVMADALAILRGSIPRLRARMVLPNAEVLRHAQASGLLQRTEAQVGGLAEALKEADVAMASTGTVMLECAIFGVPTVALYKTSWSTYQIARRIVKVKYLAMPNLLANEMVFPEFIQNAARPESVATAALGLLRDEARRSEIKRKLAQIARMLGEPGATERAARAIVQLAEGKDMAMWAGLGAASTP